MTDIQTSGPRSRIAVVGAGISGMGAAHMLAPTHDVTLFEDCKRLGGHARTRMAGRRGDQSVDTGFIVYNEANYPHLTALFAELEVTTTPSNMSFGASFDGGRLEYALHGLDALFAQRRNAANPRFLRMVRDIFRFNRYAIDHVDDPDLTVGGLMDRLRLGRYFRDHYLLPFSGAIWSTPKSRIEDFPAASMIRFFDNHNLLGTYGQHQWYTVAGGSVEYVRRLGTAMTQAGVQIRLDAAVRGVRRTDAGVEIRAHGSEWEAFDDVIFATHSDDTLALLSDADTDERADLGAIRYQPNRVVLHSDTAMMPTSRKCWASWVYTEPQGRAQDEIDLTYWMNSLQPWLTDDPLFVTLNTDRRIDESLIWDETVLRHPVYDTGAIAAQKRLAGRNGARNTWVCGAWMKNGFHEDGLGSAVDVVRAIQGRSGLRVAAE